MLPLLLSLLVSIAPARADDAAAMAAYTQWQLLRDNDLVSIPSAEGMRFLREHPGWPEEKSIRLRTEAAALLERPDDATMRSFCADFPPITGRGMFACLRAGAGDAKQLNSWLHDGWVQGDFNDDEEKNILSAYGNALTTADHIARIDRLLFEGKVSPAKRMLILVPMARHTLYGARMALIMDERNAETKLHTVPANLRNDPGLLFDRIGYRARKNKDADLTDLFLASPRNPPYADLWWPQRAIATREALARRSYDAALAILAGHGDLKPETLADALFLKGWIILQFKHDGRAAYREFYKLYTNVGTPVSKARAAYWAGRAAIRNGNRDIAREWMVKAAKYPTVFYGQLAHEALHEADPVPLKLPPAPDYTSGQKAAFEREELVQVVRMLAQMGDTKMRDKFMTTMASNAENPARFALLAELGRELGALVNQVRVAKSALRKNVVMVDAGWPKISLPDQLGVEPALALSISRQESEFDSLATSPANARGLMQLLPSTARQVAEKHGMGFTDSMLDDPQINVTLGTSYLGQIIEGFDGSYILGIASYNAGPGSVRRWIAQRGAPPKTLAGAVDWVESIPFGETRNYVMRALENVQIYRALENPSAAPQLAHDLTR